MLLSNNIAIISSLSQFNILYRKFLFINILETNKLYICHHSPLYFLKIFHVDQKLVLFETTANLFTKYTNNNLTLERDAIVRVQFEIVVTKKNL